MATFGDLHKLHLIYIYVIKDGIKYELYPHRNYYAHKVRGLRLPWISAQMNNWYPWQLKKSNILGAVLELPPK